jgi:hypothetical protein
MNHNLASNVPFVTGLVVAVALLFWAIFRAPVPGNRFRNLTLWFVIALVLVVAFNMLPHVHA